MQRFKPNYADESYKNTFANVQRCFRLNDFEEIGDGTHHCVFHMLGLFSFHEWSLQQSVSFWIDFLGEVGVVPDYVTIHPDKVHSWKSLYPSAWEIRPDTGCTWSDGEMGGYCTEFYKNDVEIGNIVNTNATSIDVGFGAERIDLVLGQVLPISRTKALAEACQHLIDDGIRVGNNGREYVLKKLLVELFLENGTVDHPFFAQVEQGMLRRVAVYTRISPRNQDKTPEWWWDTHGVDVRVVQRVLDKNRTILQPQPTEAT
jgi:alanyl-tRNA synthetase